MLAHWKLRLRLWENLYEKAVAPASQSDRNPQATILQMQGQSSGGSAAPRVVKPVVSTGITSFSPSQKYIRCEPWATGRSEDDENWWLHSKVTWSVAGFLEQLYGT